MGLRIRTRLLVLAVLPAGVSGVFASANVAEANERAAVASQLVPATEHLAAINEAHAAVLAERFGGMGEVILRSMGIPPELTVEYVDFDLRAIVEDARGSLDRALARVPPSVLAPGVRETLAEARALVESGSSDAEAVAELMYTVEESLRTARGIAARQAEELAARMDDGGTLDQHVRAMSAYGLLMSAATDETTSLGETIFPDAAIGARRVVLAEAMAKVDFAEELMVASLDDGLLRSWEAVADGPAATSYASARQAELPIALVSPVEDVSERVQMGLDLSRVARLAKLIALGMDRSEAWSGFAPTLARVIEREAGEIEAQAYEDARRATVLAIAYLRVEPRPRRPDRALDHAAPAPTGGPGPQGP